MTDLTPAAWFTAAPGADGTILHRRDIRRWLNVLADSCPYVRVEQFGTSTEGRPMNAVYIGNDIAGTSLNDLVDARQRSVARLRVGHEDADWTKPVVLVTSGIHATEIGGPQCIPELAWWLACSDDAAATLIRKRITVIIVPTLNPDGMDLVCRWHTASSRTTSEGSEPPLLYHRFAGHDNNRDWVYRNLAETREVMQAIHDRWYPHVTLDQHQMSPYGPRFALPPYADPWEPNIHPSIVAASTSLGQAIASDMSLDGLAGVMTGRYFDAWEPSRAIQHYRGGIRILAEAASARLAYPIDVTRQQLLEEPLPQPTTPSTSMPLPWHGGTWRLRDIVDYHLAAAQSLLRHVAEDPQRWVTVQRDALASRPEPATTFSIPYDYRAIDRSANRRLASVLTEAGIPLSVAKDATETRVSTDGPGGALAAAVLLPKRYPELPNAAPYDVTTHHLPLTMGASITVASEQAGPATAARTRTAGRYLVIDARCHEAPNAIEAALSAQTAGAWRVPARVVAEGALVDAGSWIIDSTMLDDRSRIAPLASRGLASIPSGAVPVHRRDIVLLGSRNTPSADHGWTRWWLHARAIPHLEGTIDMAARLFDVAPCTTVLIPDTGKATIDEATLIDLGLLIEAGATVIAVGAAGRALATSLSGDVTSRDRADGRNRAAGALLRLVPDRASATGLGLDRAVPMMFERDGTFSLRRGSTVRILGRLAARDTLISGWMPDASSVAGSPVIVQIDHGDGRLIAFSFRPLFRAQMLVTSPLVHNLLYADWGTTTCPRFDQGNTPDDNTSDRTS